MSRQEHYLKLNRTGDHIPLIGFGTARISPEDTEEVIYNAIKTGYRSFDAALLYGNEPQVGKAIRRAISEGIVKREELFVIGKLWNHFHKKDNVRPAFNVTFENFGLDYIDLYLVHFPLATEHVDPKSNFPIFNSEGKPVLERSPLHETWKELEKLVDEGLVRNIGVSNYNTQTLLDLLAYARIKPAVLEIEQHAYFQQARLIKWVKKQNIQVIAYASFGNAVFDKVPPHLEHLPNLLQHPTITKIAEKHNLNSGQVLLSFAAQQDIVVIPKTAQVSRMKTNLDIFSHKLDDEDIAEIEKLETRGRFNDFYESNYGFDLPFFD